MSCQNHPNKESVSTCQFCGKKLCEECSINIAGKTYCEECMSELVGPELASLASNKNLNNNTPQQANNVDKDPIQENKIPETNNIPVKEDRDIAPERHTSNNIPQNNIIKDEMSNDTQQNLNNDNKNNNDDINNDINNNVNNNVDTVNNQDIYSDDRLYNDINEETKSTNKETEPTHSHSKIEEKYEKYLDDLYFDEKSPSDKNSMTQPPEGLSLSEQLAMDEAEHGSITKEPYVPEVEEEPEIITKSPREFENNDEGNNRSIPIMKNLRNENFDEKENIKEKEEMDNYSHSSLHRQSIHYKKKEKTSSSSTERILTIVLIILIILVVIYLIYLFTLHGEYPSFLEALGAFFSDPGKVLGQMSI